MASTAVKPYKIIDRRGLRESHPTKIKASAAGWGLYQTPRSSGQSDFYRPRPWGVTDLRSAIDSFEWQELLEYSRQLFAQVGNLASAVIQKNTYAVGDAWKPQFAGMDKVWGGEAEEWLHQVWMPQCDIRGGVFDFKTNLFLSGIAWDVDGDDGMIMAVREDGFPVLKFISANQICSEGGEISGGTFDGARICNGVIVDRNDATIGVRVRSYEGDEPEDIPIQNIQVLFEPEWRAQYRGIPRIARVILDWFDVQDIDTYLKRIVKRHATIALKTWTEEGEPPPGANIVTRDDGGSGAFDPPSNVKVDKLLGGEAYHFYSNRGENMEAFDSKTPSQNNENFVNRIERRGINAVGWFYELMDPSKIGGASVRMIQDQARKNVRGRQGTQNRRALRAVQFAVAQAMKTGRIRRTSAPDWGKWVFELPAELTVDQGYDEAADQENLKLGTTTLSAVCGKKGRWWEDNRDQRKVENLNLIDCAIELMAYAKTKGETLAFREAIELMEQRGVSSVTRSETTSENVSTVTDEREDAQGAKREARSAQTINLKVGSEERIRRKIVHHRDDDGRVLWSEVETLPGTE